MKLEEKKKRNKEVTLSRSKNLGEIPDEKKEELYEIVNK